MAVTLKKMYTFAIDPEAHRWLKVIKEKEGIPESEQVRRGIALWLKSRGVKLKSAPRTKKR
jgi:hypothetical protein